MSDELTAEVTKLLKALEGVNVQGPTDRSGHGPGWDRFDKINARMQAAEEGLRALEAKHQQYVTASEAAVEEIKASAAAQVGQQEARHVEDIALMDLGVTDVHGRTALRNLWSGLDESARGESVADYWSAQVAAHKAHADDPAAPAPDLPRTVAGYLPPLGDTKVKPTEVRTGLTASLYGKGPDANTSTKPPPGAEERIAAARGKGAAALMAELEAIDREQRA